MSIYDEMRLNNKSPKSNLFFDFIKGCTKLLLLFSVLVFLLKALTNTTEVTTEMVVDLNNLPSPIQIDTRGGTTKEIAGGNAEITYLAEYSLSGRVVDVEKYSGYSVENQLSPRDVGIAWGFLARDENQSKLKWTSAGNRYLSWYTPDASWLDDYGGKNNFKLYWSNNHLIPCDSSVEKLVKKIEKDDYVKIDGYLARIYWTNDSGRYFTWDSSTSRSDSGNGACEVIYVTDVKWLK